MTPQDLIARVCKARGVCISKLRSKNRCASVVRARQEAMFLLREYSCMSYPEIGRLLSRDHSTVMYGVVSIGGETIGNPDYGDELRIMAGVSFARALLDAAAAMGTTDEAAAKAVAP